MLRGRQQKEAARRQRGDGFSTYITVRGSFRILNLTPWSAKDLDRKVDSAIPGKLLGGDTVTCQYNCNQTRKATVGYRLTSKPIREYGF